jgi:hydroxymethylbilane synthase
VTDRVTIGSRGSKLALTQSNWVADELRRFHPALEVEIVEFKTTGDIRLGASLSEIGGKGAFTKELEDALLDGRCDLAVHSLKDLPTELPAGLRIGCTPPREVVDDALVYRERLGTIDDDSDPLGFLPEAAVVGTSSLRRRAQLLNARPDITVVEWRGNVDTRLDKLDKGEAHAIILAGAGLARLGLIDVTTRPDNVDSRFDALALKAPAWLPAVGQGALGIEVREGDTELLRLLTPLHDGPTFAATAAERAFLNRLGAGCMAPVGALGVVPEGSSLRLTGRVFSRDGATRIEHTAVGGLNEPEALGVKVAEWCLRNGAEGLV